MENLEKNIHKNLKQLLKNPKVCKDIALHSILFVTGTEERQRKEALKYLIRYVPEAETVIIFDKVEGMMRKVYFRYEKLDFDIGAFIPAHFRTYKIGNFLFHFSVN